MDGRIALVLHGGAGARRGRDYGTEIGHMAGLVETARDRLAGGAAAVEVAVETVRALEASGLYVAGRGASPNLDGRYELDAAVMDGASGLAGAVAALEGFESPVLAARAVMERTPHVLLAGAGAAAFARACGLAKIADPAAWFTPASVNEDNHAPGLEPGRSAGTGPARLAHGTVGCAALDAQGRLAAASSTGGVFDKLPGRVGDTPLIGAGVWADNRVAVACTGQGEIFIRTAAAVQLAHRLRWAGQDLVAAARAVIESVGADGGDGGLIALGRDGTLALPYNSAGMKRAALHPDGRITAAVFG